MSTATQTGSRVISRRLLLASLSPDTTAFENLAANHWEALDWDWLLERAVAHRIAALFAARLDQLELTAAVPDSARSRLERIRHQARHKAVRAQRTLQEVGPALTRKAIPFLVIKGSVLAEHVYGDPNLRPFSDVDLVVPLEMLAQAEDVLVSLGYRFYSPPVKLMLFPPLRAQPAGPPDSLVPEAEARQLYRRYHYHFPFVPPKDDERLPVDLHWHLDVFTFDPTALWQRTASMVVADTPVRTLNLEATLVHAATHAMARSAARFKLFHLCDVTWLVARFGPQFRSDLLWALADAWGARHYLDRSLQAAEEILGFHGDKTIKSLRKQNFLLRCCFRLAARDGSLVDQGSPEGKLRRLGREVFRELFWELALCRLPRRAMRRVARAVTSRLSRWKYVWLEAKGET